MWMREREGGRCACRGWSLASGSSLCLPFSPVFSSRSFFSPFYLSATAEKAHLQSSHHFLISSQFQLGWSGGLLLLFVSLWTILLLPLSAVQQGLSSDTGVLSFPSLEAAGEGGGGVGVGYWMRVGTGVLPCSTSQERGRTRKSFRGGKERERVGRQREGFRVKEGWRGSGWGEEW